MAFPRSSDSTSPLQEAAVLAELDRVLASREFSGADRLSRFLRFVVERTLAGDRDSLKESVIGTQVFDREPSYDPKADPIVRTAALRLRAKLDEYYAEPGRPYLIKFSMPKGAYLAAFEPRPQPIALPSPEVLDQPKLEESAGAHPEKQAAEQPRQAFPRKWLWITGVVVVIVLTGIAYPMLRPISPRTQPAQSTITSYPGRQEQPTLSPDGSQIAFVWD